MYYVVGQGGFRNGKLGEAVVKRSLFGLTDLPVSHVHPHTLLWELYVEDGMI